jgi:hypothetical protein
MQTEHPTPQSLDAAEPPAGIQYHPTTLAVKHGISRNEARKALAAAGSSRERADAIALTISGKRTPPPVDEATHGSGNRNADHEVGSDQQKLSQGIRRQLASEEDAFRLPEGDKNGGGIKRP